MPKHLTPWPDEKIAELRRRFDAGETYLAMSLEMDVDDHTIRRRVKAFGWTREKRVTPSPEQAGTRAA